MIEPTYGPSAQDFRITHGDAFKRWINNYPIHEVRPGVVITFDEAHVE
jgi:hypothetical protein